MKFSSDEKILHELKPKDRLMFIWSFTKCLVHGIFLGFFFFMIIYFQFIFSLTGKNIKALPDFSDLFLFGTIFSILVLVLSYVYHRYLIKTITYYITNKRCIYVGGILRKVEHSVPYYKITDVERARNIVEQILGLSTINLFTPGTASIRTPVKSQPVPELSFVGLSKSEDEAETINEHVRIYASRQPGDV